MALQILRLYPLPVVFWGLFLPTLARAEEPKANQKAKDVVSQFLKALQAKDVEQMLKFADVPWLAEDQRIVKDGEELRRLWRAQLQKSDFSKMVFEVINALPFSKMENQIKEEASRKLLGQVLGKSDWIAFVDIEKSPARRYVLVRERAGSVKVIGGPYKFTYLLRPNQIPDAVKNLLATADEFELLSLDPQPPLEKPKGDFHGWKVLGRTSIKDEKTRKTLITVFTRGVAENEGVAFNCFDPRHGIHIAHKDKAVDLVSCFKCFQVQVFEDVRPETGFLITASPQPAFNEVLRAAGVPRAPAK